MYFSIFHLILVVIFSILIMFVKNRGLGGGGGLLNGQNALIAKKVFCRQSLIWRFRQSLHKCFYFFLSPASCTIFVFLFILALCWHLTWPICFYFLFFVNVALYFFIFYNNLTNWNTRRYFTNLTENLFI